MAILNRPNSVEISDLDTEETQGLGVRVDDGSDVVVFTMPVIMDEDSEQLGLSEYGMSVEETLSLISDLVTAVQVALANRT
jgi:hypothetical protein